MNYLSETVQKS